MASREDVYQKFGLAAEAAQLFETELGTVLLALEGMKRDWHVAPNPEDAGAYVDQINRKTLGRLLGLLEKSVTFEGDLRGKFQSALETRNKLIHGFFLKHNFGIQTSEGRETMLADLERMHEELFIAWQLASKLSEFLTTHVVRDRLRRRGPDRQS